ncbi:MAG: MEMO1 family protein [Candidatus Diapherotrites archaeon]
MIRETAVAGQFYPLAADELKATIEQFFSGLEKESNSLAVIAPHAGYVYSGQIAAKSFAALKKAGTYVIIGPNHTGFGEGVSIYPPGKWRTPLGEVEIDNELSSALAESIGVERDESAHISEHSLEVQLPFLQFLYGNSFKIVPICVAEHSYSALVKLGKKLAGVSRELDVAVIASSDFSHFIPEAAAREKDLGAIEMIKNMDIEGFYNKVGDENLSICGFAPITATMAFCLENGLKKAQILEYGSSADTIGDKTSVVGYAALKFG